MSSIFTNLSSINPLLTSEEIINDAINISDKSSHLLYIDKGLEFKNKDFNLLMKNIISNYIILKMKRN